MQGSQASIETTLDLSGTTTIPQSASVSSRPTMQGPRLLSHRSEHLITVHRPERKDTDRDDDILTKPETPSEEPEELRASLAERRPGRLRDTIVWCRRHLRFLGPGLIASAAYIDPGNYATDLQAGASYGYKLLFIVLLAGFIGIMMQILAARLGIVTGKDVAALCRQSLHSRDRHRMFWRWGVLYPLYFIAEAAIIFTDLAELLGTAIAFNLLIPRIPLYAGVLLTSLDVFIVLIAFNSYPSEKRNRSITAFEILISVLVLTVMASFIVLIVKLSPDWADVFDGYVPSKTVVSGGALYVSVGIIGATVMPHALFLGSKLGTIARTDDEDDEKNVKPSADIGIELANMAVASSPRHRSHTGPTLHMPQPTPMPSLPLPPFSGKARSVNFIRTHLHHAQLDIASSLFCFALVVNSAILIVASAAFYYGSGEGNTAEVQEGNLFAAHALIRTRIGDAFAYLFALALMMSGQAASITATLAGQVVGEGFIDWQTTPWKRRVITRLISMIPSLAVAAGVGQNGVNTLLVASQVTLSLVLPFVLFPLLAFTSSQVLMSIPRPVDEPVRQSPSPKAWVSTLQLINPFGERRPNSPDEISFANNFFFMTLGWVIFAVIVLADVYALVQLGLGQA